MKQNIPTFSLLCTLLTYSNILAERVSDKIYSNLQSDHYCSRRLNGTHQVGCQSELGGNLGIVWIVESVEDLDHILNSGPTPPYMPILKKRFFTRKNLLQFKKNIDRVSGVVFLDIDHDNIEIRTSPFSPDDICPNRYSGLYVNDTQYGDCKHAWQEESPISGLLYDDIPFPIFLINEQKSIKDIESCFNANNVIEAVQADRPKDQPMKTKRTQAAYPLCGIQLDSFMLAAKDSEFCLNSRFLIDEILQSNSKRCEFVDNHSIFAYFKPAIGPLHSGGATNSRKPSTTDDRSIVMLIAKLSSISMFSEMSPGADSTITSIVTLLAVAEALGRVKNSPNVRRSKRNIAFALLDSEPFDYTGSSRMVYDMLSNSFPYNDFITDKNESIQNTNLSSIDYLIDLDQMANYPNSETIYFHSDPRDSAKEKLEEIFNRMAKIASSENVKLERKQDTIPLPPTSAHEFIKHSQSLGTAKLSGLVLSNYGKTYKNLHYHSIYDDLHNIDQTSMSRLVQHLTQVSKFVARSLYEVAFNVDDSREISVNSGLVEQLLKCYLNDAQCPWFTRACRAGQKLPSGPIPTYKDPAKRSDDMNGIITANLLAYFIGDKMKDLNYSACYSENDHSISYSYIYINDKDEPVEDGSSGVCVRSQVLMTSSFSPAYDRVNDEIVINSKYPAWTVSLNSIRNPVRLYLKPSPLTEWFLFVLGISVTIASFITVHALKIRIKNLGINPENVVATST